MNPRSEYDGPALFSYGFRPFFLAATLFGLGVLPLWLLVWQGDVELGGPFSATDWHVHEMIFGYGAAVVAGFLFTAVPNWTGRMPAQGWPLVGLLALWILGRLAVGGAFGIGALAALAIDSAFLLAVAAMITREIVAGRNWRNLKVLVPVTLLWVANLVFHVEAMTSGLADHGRRFGIALLIFLITLIGGRIVPSFTRNWLAKRQGGPMPVPFGRYDGVCLGAGAVALAGWTVAPFTGFTGAAMMLAAALHLVRLSRWRGLATWSNPLLLMLHAAYLFVSLGFLAGGLAAFGMVGPAVVAHVFGIGAVGGMTVAVMMRATLGHTGRTLVADRALTGAFVLLLLALLARITTTAIAWPVIDGVVLATILWTASFGLLAWRLVPWLALPKAARRSPNRAAAPQ